MTTLLLTPDQPGVADCSPDLPADLLHLLLLGDDPGPGGEAHPQQGQEGGGVTLTQQLVKSFPPQVTSLKFKSSDQRLPSSRSHL